MNHSSPRHRQAFTLIELLVVITVIAILAGLILNTAGYIQKKSARSRAEAEVAALSAAIESYKLDFGDYPTSTGNGSSVLYEKLVAGDKLYFEPNNSMLSVNGTTTNLVDPFGSAYNYTYPGNATRSGTNFFDLWSEAGANPKTDTNQWIKNW